ncbi:MAG: NAD(+) kinase, partial [Bacteroidia bacterium]|nr:NAD(+) kinase [Bacteroidia bacterium]
MKVAIYARSTNDNVSEHIQALFHKLNEYKTEIYVYEPYYQFIKQKLNITGLIKTFSKHSELA